MSSTSTPLTQTVNEPLPGEARGRRLVLGVLGSWLLASTVLGASGWLIALPKLAFPALMWGTFFVWVAIYRRSPDVRTALSRVGLWAPILFHLLVRTGYGIGIGIEGARGGFPKLFADVAGPGDIAVGVLAALALPFAWRRDTRARRLLWGWNALALLDIVVAFVLAQREIVFGAGPSAFPAVQQFPYAWLPTFVLPLIFATHVWVFARLRPVQ
jgi:hypothetical protein